MADQATPTNESNKEKIWSILLTLFLIAVALYFFHGVRTRFKKWYAEREKIEESKPKRIAGNIYQEDVPTRKYLWSYPFDLRDGDDVSAIPIESDVPVDIEINETTIVTMWPTAHPNYRPLKVNDVLKRMRFRINTDPMYRLNPRLPVRDEAKVRVTVKKQKFRV